MDQQISKAVPVTKMILDNCSNFTIESHSPATVCSSESPQMRKLWNDVNRVKKELKKCSEKQKAVLQQVISTNKSEDSSSTDPNFNNFKDEMLQKLEQILTEITSVDLQFTSIYTGNGDPNDDDDGDYVGNVTVIMEHSGNDDENKENVPPPPLQLDESTTPNEPTSAIIEPRDDFIANNYRKLVKPLMEIDVNQINNLIQLLQPFCFWVIENLTVGLMDVLRGRRMLLHLVNFETNCQDSSCPTCHGNDMTIYEDKNGDLFVNGEDLILECAKSCMVFEGELPTGQNPVDVVFSYLQSLYPNVIAAYGKEPIREKIKAKLPKRSKRLHEKKMKSVGTQVSWY